MSGRSGSIVKRTAAELRARRQRGEAQVNWKDAAERALPSGNDADDAMEEIDWATTALPAAQGAHRLRLDADMLSWFRGQGRGYQTKINAIFRSYFEQHTR